MKTKLITLTSALLLGLILSGCGGNDSNGTASAAAEPKATPDQVVTIEGNDQMKFNITEFEVERGATIKLVLKNVGTMPKFSMGHNVVVLKKGTDPKGFVEAAMNSAASDYIPASRASDIIAHTRLLGGGEEDSIIFVAPSSKGEYPFVCSFPGHLQVGMQGIMQVK